MNDKIFDRDAIRAHPTAAQSFLHQPDPLVERQALEYWLAEHLEDVALAVLGRPSRSPSDGFRWGDRGARSLVIRGPKRGTFSDFVTELHGGPLMMVAYGLAFGDGPPDDAGLTTERWQAATAWAREYLNSSNGQIPNPPAGSIRSEPVDVDPLGRKKHVDTKSSPVGRAYWAQAVPIDGTPAERYLTQTRKIPAAGWPAETVRYNTGIGALVVALTDEQGAVQGVQAVYLTTDGKKRPVRWLDGGSKQTFGGGNLMMRLPGIKGHLGICEGPENALSVWAAKGFETWSTLGSLGKANPNPEYEKVYLCRDDDALAAPSNRNIEIAVQRWIKQGVRLRTVWPWAIRRYDKSDFNDVLQEGGIDAVHARFIEPALPLKKSPPSIEAARAQLREGIQGFFQDLTPGRAVGKAGIGLGKSEITRQEISAQIRKWREDGDRRTVVYLVPTHRLGDEAAKRFGPGIKVATWRGRRADDPDQPGKKMCQNLEAVAEIHALKGNVDTACCRRPKSRDGKRPEVKCEFFDICGYQRQKAMRGDVIIAAHNMLHHRKPEAFGKVGAIVVDETHYQTSIYEGSLHFTPSFPLGFTIDN